MVKKNNVLYQNGQLHNECSLITVWNAARFWGIKSIPRIGFPEYNRICKDLGGFGDGCYPEDILKELNRLKLKKINGFFDISWIRENLPIEFIIYVKYNGKKDLHSTLAVDVIGQKILLLNYENGPNPKWVYFSQIKKMSGFYDEKVFTYVPKSIVKI